MRSVCHCCLLCNLFFFLLHFTARELHWCCSDLSHHGLEKAPADEIFIEQMKRERSFIIPQWVASARIDIVLSRPTKSRSDVLIARGTYSVWEGGDPSHCWGFGLHMIEMLFLLEVTVSCSDHFIVPQPPTQRRFLVDVTNSWPTLKTQQAGICQ